MRDIRVTYYAPEELLDPFGVVQAIGTVPREGDARRFSDPGESPAPYREGVWFVSGVEWADRDVCVYLRRPCADDCPNVVERFDGYATRATDAVVSLLEEWGEDALPPEHGSEDAAVVWWRVRDALAPKGSPGYRAEPEDGEGARP